MRVHLAITERRVWTQRTKAHHTTTTIPHTISVSSHDATVSYNDNGSYNVDGPSQNKTFEGSHQEEVRQGKFRQRTVHRITADQNIDAHKGAHGRHLGKSFGVQNDSL